MVFAPRLFQYANELLAFSRRKQRQSTITTEGDEVQMALAVVALQTVWHGRTFYMTKNPPLAAQGVGHPQAPLQRVRRATPCTGSPSYRCREYRIEIHSHATNTLIVVDSLLHALDTLIAGPSLALHPVDGIDCDCHLLELRVAAHWWLAALLLCRALLFSSLFGHSRAAIFFASTDFRYASVHRAWLRAAVSCIYDVVVEAHVGICATAPRSHVVSHSR